MTTKEILFFATKEDLIEIFEQVESTYPIKYVRRKNYRKSTFDIYFSITEIPYLGINATGEHLIENYVILGQNENIEFDMRRINTGEIIYSPEHIYNEASVVFCPSGFFKNNFLIHGTLSTIVLTKESQTLYKLIQKEMLKQFKKVPKTRFYVSQRVVDLPPEIRLITISAKQLELYDLKIDNTPEKIN